MNTNLLVWLDMEMTGLDPEKDTIIEIATVLTDSKLRIVEKGPEIAIYQPESILSDMDEWNTYHHGKSGLIHRVKKSKDTLADAERRTLDFLKRFVKPQSSPLCGSSVHHDKRFLYRYMPDLAEFFHYRIIDVSSIKELVLRWNRPVAEAFAKEERVITHVAMDDVKASIAELAYYRDKGFLVAQ